MPSQRQTVQMPSQSQMSQGEDGVVSQEHSVEMASQGSQVEIDTEYTATLPLRGALKSMDDHNNIIQDQTAECGNNTKIQSVAGQASSQT